MSNVSRFHEMHALVSVGIVTFSGLSKGKPPEKTAFMNTKNGDDTTLG